MPKLIDWGVRFDLIREAVVRLAARGGAQAVTLTTVAAEMRMSPSTLRRTLSSPDVLGEMGVVWIARQREYPRHGGRPKAVEHGSLEHAVWGLWRELPTDRERVDHERAWRELTGLGASPRSIELRDQHDAYLDSLTRSVIEILMPPGQPQDSAPDLEVFRLRALIDGLTRAACRASITVEQMRAVLERHLAEVAATPRSPITPGVA